MCLHTGTPAPDVLWSKDNVDLTTTKDTRIIPHFDVKQDLHILSIKNADIEDEGLYSLIVTNSMGSVSVTILVTAKMTETLTNEDIREDDETITKEVVKVEEPRGPKIEVAPEPVTFTTGETILLSCKVSGQAAQRSCVG